MNPDNFSLAQPTSYINETDSTAANVGYGGPMHGDHVAETLETQYYPASLFPNNYPYDYSNHGWNSGVG